MSVASRRAFWAALCAVAVAAVGLIGVASVAWAAHPEPWQMGFQPPASPVMEEIENFHDELLVIITVITAFVLGLLLYVMWRFSEKRNPTPSKTTHNTVIEVVWTVVPVLILVYIAFKSFPLLYFTDVTPEPDMTIKATGHQWFWSYEYPDNGNFTFDAYMIQDADIDASKGQYRLLEADNQVVVPIDATVKVLLAAEDVIHAFAMPAFGVKEDAVPGRLNETWFKATKEGVYYGQCSELCGKDHAFMPIAVRVVSEQAFNTWLADAKKKYGSLPDTSKFAEATGR
ncbi:MAG TPA: cytochrome c oxidase subunit II [Verrucomicrobiae bacterium]|nr:cytochrome c oxidase subunit II [Verrucomicrobiae bacterium]